MISGAALSGDGLEQGSMGVDWGDYLHEGRLSMFVTNFTEQPDTLYRNLGAQGFSDVSWAAKLAQPTFIWVGWGTAFFDMDNDGWLDIFAANGHVYPQMDNVPGAAHYKEPMLLFRNNRDGTFADISDALASFPLESRRGAAFGDVNNDGNVDILLLNIGGPPTLLLNEGGNSNHRVLFKLVGAKSNKSAIGARVTVSAGKLVQLQRSPGRSKLSLAERSAAALWTRCGREDDRRRNPLAPGQDRDLARHRPQTSFTRSSRAKASRTSRPSASRHMSNVRKGRQCPAITIAQPILRSVFMACDVYLRLVAKVGVSGIAP